MDADTVEEILSTVRRFVREAWVPREQEIEDTDAVPDDLRLKVRELGLYGFALPEEHGGLGLSMVDQVRLVMELGWTTPALRSMVGTNNGIAGGSLLLAGTDSQRASWLPQIAGGEIVASFALTEADAGSDPSSLVTTAKRTDDGWVLNGTKRYITNAPLADVFMVYARTDSSLPAAKGISTFLVPRETAGVSCGPRDHKMGQRGAWTCDVILDDVQVPYDALLGGEEGLNTGYLTAMKVLSKGRVHIAALCVGMAERLVHESVSFAAIREQGGKLIGEHQLVQGLIADSITDWRAAKALVLNVARDWDSGTDQRQGPAIAKYFASEAVGRVADRAVQVHGGAGYINGVAVERFYRDARLFRIYEGTSQIQQTIIARQALARASRP